MKRYSVTSNAACYTAADPLASAPNGDIALDTETAPILLEDVTVRYGVRPVLQGLSLQVAAGTVTALLGGNGAGKSTTLAALLGFVKAEAGKVLVASVDPAKTPDEARRQIAYLPENVALYEHLTAIENAEYLLALSCERHSHDAITAAFGDAGLQETAWGQRLGGFSKGMRQKVAIAVALLRQTPVVLLDEPTSGLDPQATADFNLLLARVRERGAAVLMVTHDLLSAADVADRIAFLEGGRIVADAMATGVDRFDVRALRARFGGRAAA
nr:ATP-binding cassette domain-containing protein [Brevundimonas diminuta]